MGAIEVSYTVSGNGPPLYMVHGIGSRRETWDGLLPELEEHFTCVRYDLRGHGESPIPPVPYTLDDLVDDLEALRQRLGHDRIHVIGHSLGGRNTVYLQAFDERVKVGVSSCGWTTFRSMILLEERLLATDYFMPFLKTKYNLNLTKFPFEYTDAFAAIAPRVFYSYSPAGDGVHPGWGPAAAAPVIQKFYEACGAKDAFIFNQPAGDHRFPWTWRQNSYRTLRDTLNYHPHGALGLLAERNGKEAIPILKRALDDPSPKNRWVAAHHLGEFGDRSGLARMKQDLKSFSSTEGAPPSPNETPNARLVLALEVAKVLAELGDGVGYALAAQSATRGGQRT